MTRATEEKHPSKIKELERRLSESEQLILAIKAGEVDAFAFNNGNQSEIFTLQSDDYAYRILIEKFGEGALNLTEDKLVVYTNIYFFQLINLPYEKVIGSLFTDFIAPDSLENFHALFRHPCGEAVRVKLICLYPVKLSRFMYRLPPC